MVANKMLVFSIPDYTDVENQHLVDSFTGVFLQQLPLILSTAFYK